jgi:hypothetical protein
MIFTDGSFHTPRNPVLAVFDHHQPHVAAGSVILWAPSRGKVLAFYIDNGAEVGVDSAPTMELLALYAALMLRAYLRHPIPIHTDSKTSVDKLLAPIKALDARTAGYSYALMCHALISKQSGPLLKVQAHPERRAKPAEWDLLMWGNHMADAVASKGSGAQLKGIPPGLHRSNLQAVAVPARLIAESVACSIPLFWSVGEPHCFPTANNPYPHIAQAQLQQYLEARESYSAGLQRNRDWQRVSSSFAARCWRLNALSLKGRAAALRVIWDKGMHGGNRSKGDHYSLSQRSFLARCTVCGGHDSADHWIRRCPHEAMMQYRADCVTAINKFIGQVKIELVARVLRKVLKLAVEHTDGYRIWTANWPASCQDELDLYIQDACRKVTPAALRTQLASNCPRILHNCTEADVGPEVPNPSAHSDS